jgi:hypothetical protein
VFKYLVLPILLVGTNIATADCVTCQQVEWCPFGQGYGKVVSHIPLCIKPFPAEWRKLEGYEKVQVKEAQGCIFGEGSAETKNTQEKYCCPFSRITRRRPTTFTLRRSAGSFLRSPPLNRSIRNR